ncbi:hepatitis A virus cellular receptor 1 homolog [Menidia menidia]
MAAAAPRTVLAALLLLSGVAWPFKVPEGGVASLSCQYSVQRFGLSRVCWGRSCGTFWCSGILVQTDETGVVSKAEERFRLVGDVLGGNLDLEILEVRRSDGGTYCCRVDVDGFFNDKKVVMNLRVVKAAGPSRPDLTSALTTQRVPETSTAGTTTVNWRNLLSSQLEILRNASLRTSDSVEEARPAVSLQINAPVLSLSLCLLLSAAAAVTALALKRGIHRGTLKSNCFSSEELPHIIYEIRMRRPVQENIYTLD